MVRCAARGKYDSQSPWSHTTLAQPQLLQTSPSDRNRECVFSGFLVWHYGSHKAKVYENMQADTAPLHTVFGAALGLLLANSQIVEGTTAQSLFVPILAFAALAVTAFASEACFRRVVSNAAPTPYLIFVLALAAGMCILLPGSAGACGSQSTANPLAVLLCAELDIRNILIASIMAMWGIMSTLVAFYRKYEKI